MRGGSPSCVNVRLVLHTGHVRIMIHRHILLLLHAAVTPIAKRRPWSRPDSRPCVRRYRANVFPNGCPRSSISMLRYARISRTSAPCAASDPRTRTANTLLSQSKVQSFRYPQCETQVVQTHPLVEDLWVHFLVMHRTVKFRGGLFRFPAVRQREGVSAACAGR